MESYRFELSTDHFQLYLQDWDAEPDTSAIWDEPATAQRLAGAEGLIAVATERYGGITSVTVEIHTNEPAIASQDWDHIVYTHIRVGSGRLMLYSPEMNYQGAYHLPVEPGLYEILVCYGDIDGFDDELDETGDDHYLFAIWKGEAVKTQVIKHHRRAAE